MGKKKGWKIGIFTDKGKAINKSTSHFKVEFCAFLSHHRAELENWKAEKVIEAFWNDLIMVFVILWTTPTYANNTYNVKID